MVSRRFMPPLRSSTLLLAFSVQLHEVEQLVGPLADLGLGDPEVAAVDVEVVADVELVVEGVLLRADPEPAADRRPVGGRVHPEDPQLAAADRRTAAIIRIVLDLPAPLGPRNPNASPRCTSTSMPLTASNSPGGRRTCAARAPRSSRRRRSRA